MSFFAAEAVHQATDFSGILKSCPFPKLDKASQTISKCLNQYMTFCKYNKEFDLLTHGAGPGIVGCVVRHIMKFLNSQCCLKTDCAIKDITFQGFENFLADLGNYIDKLPEDEDFTDIESDETGKKKHIKGIGMQWVPNQVVTSTEEQPTYGGDSDNDWQVTHMA